MLNIRLFGAMKFPHYIDSKAEQTERKMVPVEVKNKETGIYEWILQERNVHSGGTYDLIEAPAEPLKPNDEFVHPLYNNIQFRITEVIERRPARGDWSFINFTPNFVRVRVETIKQQ